MKKLCVFSLCFGCVLAVSTSHAIDLKQSKLTQVVNDVQIISAGDQKQKSATVNDLFSMPDILRTGTASRAELVAQDETVARVGANTIFSFDPANRTIDLKQGSLLFHSPHGKGGGTIHTGSATASVLGTTLIVTTTPNGGLKVLDLEGEVEVKFLNGLKQKLDPGQMTFILPGGNQLAPVIIFRLDELTQNSLLGKGFSQSLDSLPLIKNQVEKQIKLIQSGKASDTGLYAGNDAGPNQVEVLDVNTISHGQQVPPPPPPVTPTPPPVVHSLGDAEGADATINQSSLTDASIPSPPNHVFTAPQFPLTGISFFGAQTFAAFVARNVFVNTPAVGLDPLLVDLSPYSSLVNFALVAVHGFNIEGSVTFNGLSSSDNLSLIAGHQFSLTPGIAVRADVKNFTLTSPAALTLDNVGLYNYANNINLRSGAAVSFLNGSLVYAVGGLIVSAVNDISSAGSHFIASSVLLTPLNGSILFDSTTVDASGHAIFIAPTAINLNNSTINSDAVTLNGSGTATISLNNTVIHAPSLLTVVTANDLKITGSTLNSDAAAGNVTLISSSGSATITGTSITAHNLTVSAGNNILFDGASQTPGGGGFASTTRAKSTPVASHFLKLNSGDGILLNARGQTLTASGEGATASFTAPNLITVNNADFSSFAVLNMAANTIVLSGVALAPIDTFTSANHALAPNPNTYQPIVYGDVNFHDNVTLNGVLVTAPAGFVNGTIPGTGIKIQ